MKKIIYIFIVILLISNISFADEKTEISVSTNVIDNVNNPNINKLLFPWLYIGKYDLFNTNLPDSIKIKQSGSRVWIPTGERQEQDYSYPIISRKPLLLDFLIEKIGKIKIKKYIDNGILHIIWDYNKTGSMYHSKSSDYYLNSFNDLFKGEYLSIEKKYKVYSDKNQNIELIINPFDKDIFYGYCFYVEPPYPTFSIFDNSLLPQNFVIYSNEKLFYPKIKYNLQPYLINTPYNDEIETKKSYVFLPSYEFNLEVAEWESTIELKYKKLIKEDSHGYLWVNESY